MEMTAKNRLHGEPVAGRWVVKRYQNRKYYDYKNSTFSNVEGLARAFAERPVQVWDRNNRDITPATLVSIHSEIMKKRKLTAEEERVLVTACSYPGGLLGYAQHLEQHVNVSDIMK